jgi:hypothetical protein
LPADLLDPGPDNVTGHWEPKAVVDIHEDLLTIVGSAWDDIAAFPRSWFDSDASLPFRARLAGALRRDFGDARLIVVKDPRICRLVPLWKSVLAELDIEPLFVIPIRNPLEIAASLERRDQFPQQKSLLLWLRYFLDAERDTRDYPRSFVAYDSLLTDWRTVVDTIGRDIRVTWPRRSDAAAAETEQFISRQHRHHTLGADAFFACADVPEWVKTSFTWALRAVERLPVEPDTLDTLHCELDTASRAFMPLVTDRVVTIASLTATVKRLTETSAAQAEQLRRELARAEKLQHELALDGDLGRRLLVRQIESNATQAAMEERMYQLQAQLARARDEAAGLRLHYDLIRNSTTWRMTAPLRWLIETMSSLTRKRLDRSNRS